MSSISTQSVRALCRPSALRSSRRTFSTILPSGEKAERELTNVERAFVNLKEQEFSKLGLYRKRTTNEATLYKLFQLAQPRHKTDYSACVFAINHFYNFGVDISHHDFTNRWLATAVETSRVDEAVQIVKLWHTWLPCPPDVRLVELLMGMVKPQQSRELLKAIRESWQMPLSSIAYSTVIAKEIGLSSTDENAIEEAMVIWRDARDMGVVLPMKTNMALLRAIKASDKISAIQEVQETVMRQSCGGFSVELD